MLILDSAAYRSAWRLRHPAEKALLAFGLLGCTIILPPWPTAVSAAAVAAGVLVGPAGVRPADLLRAARFPLGVILIGALPLLVTVGGPHLVAWNPVGPASAAQLAGRSAAALLCLLLFAATTPIADVLPRLGRCGVPPAVTEVAALTYRMLFQLLHTARAVRDAQVARLGFRTLRTSYHCLAGQGSVIFVRAFDRARRLEQGLALRGYDGSLRVDVPICRVSRSFVAGSLATVAAVAATAALAQVVP